MTQTATLRDLTRDYTGNDLATEIGRFETRIKFQKLMYLLQEAGAVDRTHLFNLYLYGPYSSKWAAEAYSVRDDANPHVEIENSRAEAVKRLIGESPSGPWMAALATLHWYVVRIGLDKDAARERAKKDGKLGLLRRFEEAWGALAGANWLHA